MQVSNQSRRVQKIIEDLESKGFIEKIEEISHRTPVSERSKAPIEIIPMEEFYLKQKGSVEKMRELGSQIKFLPKDAPANSNELAWTRLK